MKTWNDNKSHVKVIATDCKKALEEMEEIAENNADAGADTLSHSEKNNRL